MTYLTQTHHRYTNKWTTKLKNQNRSLSFLTAFSFMCHRNWSVSQARVQIKSAAVHVCFLVVATYGHIRQRTAERALARLWPILLEHTFGAKRTAGASACWEELKEGIGWRRKIMFKDEKRFAEVKNKRETQDVFLFQCFTAPFNNTGALKFKTQTNMYFLIRILIHCQEDRWGEERKWSTGGWWCTTEFSELIVKKYRELVRRNRISS